MFAYAISESKYTRCIRGNTYSFLRRLSSKGKGNLNRKSSRTRPLYKKWSIHKKIKKSIYSQQCRFSRWSRRFYLRYFTKFSIKDIISLLHLNILKRYFVLIVSERVVGFPEATIKIVLKTRIQFLLPKNTKMNVCLIIYNIIRQQGSSILFRNSMLKQKRRVLKILHNIKHPSLWI